ncbi:hypothetical protein B0A52_00293 [Exophiala mesophila]|uniref:aldehyde dehydrogenase (NAD(+)) n=1 Tax=Exophiala mesophila TaxID=212818 RepID=A0A438NJM1_EXOME|nr:hypothetical protein B0A52_00293 [Exophiala mesophila]
MGSEIEVLRTRWSSEDSSDLFEVFNPSTGHVLKQVQGVGPVQAQKALESAHHAFQTDWRLRSPSERGATLLRAADALEKHADELATTLSLENGKPFQDARAADVPFLIGVFRYFGSLIDKLPSEFYDQGNVYASVVREPFGVVLAIIPFNWPPIHTGGKLAPALACGNTVVIKPSEQAPLTVLRIVDILNTVFPPNVIHVLPAKGIALGQFLVNNSLVRKVSFTGSTSGGAAVGRAALDRVTPVTLELGGKNAFVVFEDANIDDAVYDALEGGFYNKGEACTAASRVLVHKSIHDEFVARYAAAVKKLVVGNGLSPDTHVGPVISKVQKDKIMDYIRLGESEGAVIEAQAPLPQDPALRNGFFIPPTLFTNVQRNMRIAKEEIFGPVVTVTSFETYEEAISIVNESEYGLICGIQSKNTTLAWRAARDIESGIVFINNYQRRALGTPFGGTKASGFGREHCIETLHDYSWAKNVRIPSGRGTIPRWRAIKQCFE